MKKEWFCGEDFSNWCQGVEIGWGKEVVDWGHEQVLGWLCEQQSSRSMIQSWVGQGQF